MQTGGGLKFVLLLVFAFVGIFQISGYASAQLMSASINPSVGEVGQYQVYNITVTNTNNPSGINFTQVVIVAPISLTIAGSGTSNTGTFNYSTNSSSNTQSLSWNNSAGLVKNGTSGYFWINASLNQFAYLNFTVASLDTQGNTSQTSVTVFMNDTISPFINFTSPTPANASNTSLPYIPVNVSAGDSGSGLKNITIYLYNLTALVNSQASSVSPFFYNFTNLTGGKYVIVASAVDFAGNTNQTSSLTLLINSQTVPCTVSNWSCSWSSCINGTQTQTCIDINGCNTTILINGTSACNPSLSCSPNLNCTDWLPVNCQPGQTQTKTCTDLNNCTSPTVQTQNCSTSPQTSVSSKIHFPSINLGSLSPSVIAFSAIILVIVIIIIVTVVVMIKLKNREVPANIGGSNK